jgi:pimeloyl-ACP methyl ester carboxylesterase
MVTIRIDHRRNTAMTARLDELAVRHCEASIENAPTLLFIHGYLDGATVWDDLIEALGDTVTTVRYDLPGFGTRHGEDIDPQDISLKALAAEAAAILTSLSNPVFVVGHSLGTQVAQLVAADHPDRVAGLMLLTPVPLAGTHLPEEEIATFRGLAADAGAQRTARAQLSPSLTAEQLDRLTRTGTMARPDIGARYADVWNNGLDDGPATSAYAGPVLIMGGSSDPFVTSELVDTVSARFTFAHTRTIDNGGHWLHVEYPETAASLILDFVDDIADRAGGDDTHDVRPENSPSVFGGGFSDDVVLEGSVLAKPVTGKTQVLATLAAARSMYECLQFTAEVRNATTSYLQWTARMLGGVETKGVGVVQRDAAGAVSAVTVYHGPLPAVLQFSVALRDRLADVVAAEHFLSADAYASG